MAKYDALAAHLKQLRADGEHTVKMTFGAIDRLVGGLPPSSRGRTWWANNSQNQAIAWRSAGWHVDTVDLTARWVRFTVGEVGGSYAARGRQPANATPHNERGTADLRPLGIHVDAAVHFEWSDAGQVTLDGEGRVLFPPLPAVPGIYQLTFVPLSDQHRPRIYIGESDSLARRAGNYRHPGPTQHTSVRVNAALLEHLGNGGLVTLAVTVDATITVDAMGEPLDLTRKSARLLAESAALVVTQRVGEVDIENLH